MQISGFRFRSIIKKKVHDYRGFSMFPGGTGPAVTRNVIKLQMKINHTFEKL